MYTYDTYSHVIVDIQVHIPNMNYSSVVYLSLDYTVGVHKVVCPSCVCLLRTLRLLLQVNKHTITINPIIIAYYYKPVVLNQPKS